MWLKQHNLLYKNIHVDYDHLVSLSDDDIIFVEPYHIKSLKEQKKLITFYNLSIRYFSTDDSNNDMLFESVFSACTQKTFQYMCKQTAMAAFEFVLVNDIEDSRPLT